MPKQNFPFRIGSVSIELFKGNLRLRWTYQGDRHFLGFGKPSESSLEAAKAKAHQITSQLLQGNFTKESKQPPKVIPERSLKDLWDLYYKMKLKSGIKEKTKDWFANLDRVIGKLGEGLVLDGFAVKESLLEQTTIEQTRISLKALSSCCNYAIKRKLITENPFYGVWAELPDKQASRPRCFSAEEIREIFQNFESSEEYCFYVDLVKFWLLSGCRPSEALALTWGDISEDLDAVTFRGSIQQIKGKGAVFVEGSKNFKKGSRKPQSRSRTVPIGNALSEMLMDKLASVRESSQLVFPSKSGGYLLYTNFCQRAWAKCVRSIPSLADATPYNCRDTFISMQLAKGVPIAVIAAWCDNSPSMIESRYADYQKLGSIRPAEF